MREPNATEKEYCWRILDEIARLQSVVASYCLTERELKAENARLRAALERCVEVFKELAEAGNYPAPLFNNGGWKFALDALEG
jgi:hypothetical protein